MDMSAYQIVVTVVVVLGGIIYASYRVGRGDGETAEKERQVLAALKAQEVELMKLRGMAGNAQFIADLEREMLHEIIADCNALIDPEAHPELSNRINAALLPCGKPS